MGLHTVVRANVTYNNFCSTKYCVGPVAELTTTLTDYGIFVEASFLAYWTYRSYADGVAQGKTSERCKLYMSVAFAVLAVQFVLGGSEHGFYRQLCCDASNPESECANASIIWILSMIGQAVSMSAFVVACAYSMLTPGTVQTVFIAFGVTTSAIYGVLVLVGAIIGSAFLVSFLLLIVFSAPSLLLILSLSAWAAFTSELEAASQIRNGFAIILVSVLLQVAKVSIHEYFNHNDLFHVVMMVGLVPVYFGAIASRDQTAEHEQTDAMSTATKSPMHDIL